MKRINYRKLTFKILKVTGSLYRYFTLIFCHHIPNAILSSQQGHIPILGDMRNGICKCFNTWSMNSDFSRQIIRYNTICLCFIVVKNLETIRPQINIYFLVMSSHRTRKTVLRGSSPWYRSVCNFVNKISIKYLKLPAVLCS